MHSGWLTRIINVQKLIRSTRIDQLARKEAGIDPEDNTRLLMYKSLPGSMQVAAVQTVQQLYPDVLQDTILEILSKYALATCHHHRDGCTLCVALPEL